MNFDSIRLSLVYTNKQTTMTKLSPDVQSLRNKLKYIDYDMEDRAVCTDFEINELSDKIFDLIVETDYKVDIADCLRALHLAFEDLEMYN